MRLFVAVSFSTPVKKNIIQLQDYLRKLGHGSFTPSENLHITLAFLGEVRPDRVESIKDAMRQTPFSKLDLVFDHIGSFKRNDGAIWWIGVKENPAFLQLQNRLYQNLLHAGFVLEKRRFTPHITLARRYSLHSCSNPNVCIAEPFTANINAIQLMRSERVAGKMVYTELARVTANQ